jgi:hypothetical protein
MIDLMGSGSIKSTPPVDIEKELTQLDQMKLREKKFLSFIIR